MPRPALRAARRSRSPWSRGMRRPLPRRPRSKMADVANDGNVFASIEEVAAEFRRGRFVVVVAAADRAATVQAAIDPATRPQDLLRPGHTFPLRARNGGVLKRAAVAGAQRKG